MSVPWPVDVPDCFQRDSFSRSEDAKRGLRTTVSTGPDKTRPRYSTPIPNYSGAIIMTTAEHQLFLDFYNTDLAGGTINFTTVDPLTETVEEFRFAAPPAANFVGFNKLSVSMAFDKQPVP
jgi:hypothetical protein